MRKSTVLTGLLLVLLTGCVSRKETPMRAECTYVDTIGDTYTETLVAIDNQVQSNDIVIKRDYAPDVNEGSLTLPQIIEEYDYRLNVVYANVPGLVYSYILDEAFVTETLSFDYNIISFTYLADKGYLDSDDHESIAFDLTLKSLQESGYTCDY